MAYKVLNAFKDKEDGKTYKKDDEYKKKLSKERAEVLTTKNNDYKKVFLKEVKNKKE